MYRYENVCWFCHKPISSSYLRKCSVCGWYKCALCGHCSAGCHGSPLDDKAWRLINLLAKYERINDKLIDAINEVRDETAYEKFKLSNSSLISEVTCEYRVERSVIRAAKELIGNSKISEDVRAKMLADKGFFKVVNEYPGVIIYEYLKGEKGSTSSNRLVVDGYVQVPLDKIFLVEKSHEDYFWQKKRSGLIN